MVHSEVIDQPISVIRVGFEFYPIKGGSITHMVELSKNINLFLVKQIIIAPDFGECCKEFDEKFEIPVIRLNYPKWIECLQPLKIPIVQFILVGYALNVAKILKDYIGKDTVIYIHGTMLGAILTNIIRKLMRLNIPIIILQDSANLFKISMRSALSAKLALTLFKISKPSYLLIVDDGAGISYTNKMYNECGINCEILEHAVDAEFFKPIYVENKKYEFVVLSTQRLDPFRRVDLGIVAFKRFLENAKYPHGVRLLIVGKGIEENKLREMVERENLQNWVKFCGEIDIEEIKVYLNMSDVVIGTSLNTNLNLSIQEAMAYGKAVVVFGSGETEKLVSDMENGLVAKSGDINDFARKLGIIYIDLDLRKRLGENARKTIINEKSWELRIRKELEICKKAIISSKI